MNFHAVFFFIICFTFFVLWLCLAINSSTRGMRNEFSTHTTLIKQCTLPVSSYMVKI